MKKKAIVTIVIITVLIRVIASIATNCLCAAIWVSAFASGRVDYICSYRLSTPIFSIANAARQISEERGIELYAPESTDEAVLVIGEDGIYHGYIFIPFADGSLGDDFTYYTADGRKFERVGDWIITPDRQLWSLNTQKWTSDLAYMAENSDMAIDGVTIYAAWKPSVLPEQGPLYYTSWLVKWLVKQDWFLRVRIFTLEHQFSDRMLTIVGLRMHRFGQVMTAIVVLSLSIWKCFPDNKKRARQIE